MLAVFRRHDRAGDKGIVKNMDVHGNPNKRERRRGPSTTRVVERREDAEPNFEEGKPAPAFVWGHYFVASFRVSLIAPVPRRPD